MKKPSRSDRSSDLVAHPKHSQNSPQPTAFINQRAFCLHRANRLRSQLLSGAHRARIANLPFILRLAFRLPLRDGLGLPFLLRIRGATRCLASSTSPTETSLKFLLLAREQPLAIGLPPARRLLQIVR